MQKSAVPEILGCHPEPTTISSALGIRRSSPAAPRSLDVLRPVERPPPAGSAIPRADPEGVDGGSGRAGGMGGGMERHPWVGLQSRLVG